MTFGQEFKPVGPPLHMDPFTIQQHPHLQPPILMGPGVQGPHPLHPPIQGQGPTGVIGWYWLEVAQVVSQPLMGGLQVLWDQTRAVLFEIKASDQVSFTLFIKSVFYDMCIPENKLKTH